MDTEKEKIEQAYKAYEFGGIFGSIALLGGIYWGVVNREKTNVWIWLLILIVIPTVISGIFAALYNTFK